MQECCRCSKHDGNQRSPYSPHHPKSHLWAFLLFSPRPGSCLHKIRQFTWQDVETFTQTTLTSKVYWAVWNIFATKSRIRLLHVLCIHVCVRFILGMNHFNLMTTSDVRIRASWIRIHPFVLNPNPTSSNLNTDSNLTLLLYPPFFSNLNPDSCFWIWIQLKMPGIRIWIRIRIRTSLITMEGWADIFFFPRL